MDKRKWEYCCMVQLFAPNFPLMMKQGSWFAVQKFVKKHLWRCDTLTQSVGHWSLDLLQILLEFPQKFS